MSKPTKRIRIFTAEDVAEHKTAESTWVTYKDRVYDITQFLPDHPGGDDIVLKYAGKAVDEIMKDPLEHEHSDSAYDVLSDYQIGKLGTEETIATEEMHPDNTDEFEDYEKFEFIDLRKPMVMQVLRAGWRYARCSASKSYYLKQVHQPRHLPHPARFFGPDVLEMFTRTNWYVIPIVWLPIAAYLGLRSVFQFSGPIPAFTTNPRLPMAALSSLPASSFLKTGICFVIGNIIWTFLEYLLHRFLFHLDYYLPDHPLALMLHFLMHGVHHYLPMDRLRLVMPPVLFTLLQSPFTKLAHALFPPAVANGIISGAFTFYVLYDCTHYALHHTKLPKYWTELKKYHLAHHYKNFDLGYGVTSAFWDKVFGTYLPV
ncbi:Inositolphosphorylceramide-B hydroxylase [Schizophyllum commune Tattone D]|nr:Inositolphosphorylceramide-B hydroxylase [Schizophyllum commune Loenen D]KAI5834327.1 Inositolphosphorylceramide-B hydroxylase [Schizophyllum commune Tattone D]